MPPLQSVQDTPPQPAVRLMDGQDFTLTSFLLHISLSTNSRLRLLLFIFVSTYDYLSLFPLTILYLCFHLRLFIFVSTYDYLSLFPLTIIYLCFNLRLFIFISTYDSEPLQNMFFSSMITVLYLLSFPARKKII